MIDVTWQGGNLPFGSTRVTGPLLRLSTVPANVTLWQKNNKNKTTSKVGDTHYTAAVVTLGTLNTVPRHMAYATAGVAVTDQHREITKKPDKANLSTKSLRYHQRHLHSPKILRHPGKRERYGQSCRSGSTQFRRRRSQGWRWRWSRLGSRETVTMNI